MRRLNIQNILLIASALALGALPARADAPPGRYMIGAGTVLDTKTGLTWQRTASAATYTWAAAKAFCPTLGTNWRAPTGRELLTIVDLSKANPAIDTTAFPGATGAFLWTATPQAGSAPSAAWVVDFSYGATSAFATSSTYNVRCVQ